MAEYHPSKLDQEAFDFYAGSLTSDEQFGDLDPRKLFHAIRAKAYERIHHALERDETKSDQSLKHISTLYAGRCAAELLTDRLYEKGGDLYNSDGLDLIKKSEPSDEFLGKLKELPGANDTAEELEEEIHAGRFCGIFPFC